MGDSNTVLNVFRSLLVATPVLAAWTGATVVSAIMLRRGGGKAEKFLLAGSSVMLARTLLTAPAAPILDSLLLPQLVTQGLSVGAVIQYYILLFGLVYVVGIILLVYAFWTKFKVKSGA